MYSLTRFCLGNTRVALLVLIAITSVLALGLSRVRPEFGYRVLIGDAHPAVRTLDGFIERFGGGLPIQIGWECGAGLPCDSVFDPRSLEMARAIADELRAAPGVSTVIGVPNAPLLVAAPGGFRIRRFVEQGAIAADADTLAGLATADPLWREVLVSPDATAGMIVVQPVDSSAATSRQVSDAVLRAIAPHRGQGYRFHLTGDPIQNGIVGRDLAESTARLIPFTVAVIIAILYLLSRSLRATAVALATLGVALVWTFGLLGWLGWPQDGILEVLAPLILVVGVCDSVHLLAQHADEVARADHVDASRDPALLLEAARRVAGPCLITTGTTAVAFASFTTSDLATFHRFGSIAAFGTITCLVLTFSLLPILVRFLPEHTARSVPTTRAWTVALETILDVSERRAIPILIASALLLVLCGAGWWLHLRVDHEWKESLGEASQVVRSWRFMEQRIGRSDTLEVEVMLPEDAPLALPDTLLRIRALSDYLSTLENLRSPWSIADVVERVNQLLHDDDPTRRRIASSRAANSEILELIGFDDPGLLAQWVSFDRTRVRISVGAPEQAFSTRQRILDSLSRFTEETLPPGWQVIATGRVAMQHAWIQDVQATQLRSFPTALALVFALVALFFRSLRLAFAGLIPTALPIVITLGTMGWSGMTLDVGRAMIAAILLGIGVDDSIHILDHYRRRRASGDDARAAIRRAMLHTGRAVVTTSLALALGFLTLTASAWQSISSFGFLVAIAILGALAATLFVLPALIFAFSSRAASGRPDGARGGSARLVAIAIVLPTLAVWAGATALAFEDDRPWSSPCWLLPRGHVVAAFGDCPLQLLDEITWVEDRAGRRAELDSRGAIRDALGQAGPVATVGLKRRGQNVTMALALAPNATRDRTTRIAVSFAFGAALLVLPVTALLRQRWRPSLLIPGAIFASAMAAALVPILSGQQSDVLDLAAIAAFAIAPAALLQLGMVFPSESRLVRIAPRLQLLPYATGCTLAAAGLLALRGSPVLWPAFVYLLLGLHSVAWGVLIAACVFAPCEAERRADARSAAERRATTARVATGLMRDLGKDLGWMRGLTTRLARQATRDPKLHRRASQVDALAEDLVERMQSFVREATSERDDPPGVARLDDLLERCVDDISSRWGPDRIHTSCDPTLRRLRCSEQHGAALTRALDELLSRESPDAAIQIRAGVDEDDALRITLIGADGQPYAQLRLSLPEAPGRA